MIRIFHDHDALSQSAADYIVTVGKRCVNQRGKFDLVVSGGTTPLKCYEILAEQHPGERKLWDHTHLYWADDRCVPPDDPLSNYFQVKSALLDFVNIPPAQVHRIRGEDPNPQAAADSYDTSFPLSADFLILGMGREGHTASIFPFSSVLTETKKHVVCVEVPVEPRTRITVTPRVIANAIEVLVLVSGDQKAQALERVFSETGTVQETPARLARHALWFVDKLAAERMTKHLIAQPLKT